MGDNIYSSHQLCYVKDLTEKHKRGRGLIARERIQKGQVILQEYPFAHNVFNDFRKKVCNYSLKTPIPGNCLKRCTRTRSTFFLNKNMLELAWKNGYKEESKAVVRIRQANPSGEIPEQVLFVSKVCWKIKREGSDCANEIDNLSCMWEKETEKRKAEHKRLAIMVSIMVDGKVKNEEELIKYAMLISRINTNSFCITGPENQKVAMGIFPKLGAMANHSMNPNSIAAFSLGDCGRLSLIASRDIEQGEEITISYTPIETSYFNKLNILKSQYYFDYKGYTVERPSLYTFHSENLGMSVDVRKLSEDDPGHDLQLLESPYDAGSKLVLYVKDVVLWGKDKIEKEILFCLSNKIPVASLPGDHPLNLRILRERAENVKTVQANLDYITSLQNSTWLLKFPLLWSTKISFLFEFEQSLEREMLLEISKDIVNNIGGYLKYCGDRGNDILDHLNLLLNPPDADR